MLGSSRESLTALRASLDARRAEQGFGSVSADLLAVAGVLGGEKTLRQTLADSGQPAELRTGIVASLFAGKIAAPSLAVLTDVVGSRWSNDADLVDGVEQLGAQAAFTVAETDGTLDRVEDELFAFGRAVDESPELQLALTDPSVPAARKGDLVRDLIGGSASPVSTALLAHACGNLRGRRPAAAVQDLARLASDQRRQVLAEVRSAVALDVDQHTRLVRRAHPAAGPAGARERDRRPRGRRRHRRPRGRRRHRRQRLVPTGAGAPRPLRLSTPPAPPRTDDRTTHDSTTPSTACGTREQGTMTELTIRPEDIRDAIARNVESYAPGTTREEVGRVTETGDGIARVEGLHSAMTNELLEFEGGLLGLALNLDVREIGTVLLGDGSHIEEGQTVRRTGEILSVPVGDGYLGRVVDPLGNPIDGKGPIEAEARRALELQAPSVVQRQPVKEPMLTGIKAIDAMTAIGRGQRQLIIGDRQTGKTAVAIDTIINQKQNWESGDPKKQVKCIYVAIGQKGSTIAAVKGALEESGAMEYTTIVASPASDPAGFKYLAPVHRLGHRPALDVPGPARAHHLRRPVQAGRGLPRRLAAAAPPAGPRGLPR